MKGCGDNATVALAERAGVLLSVTLIVAVVNGATGKVKVAVLPFTTGVAPDAANVYGAVPPATVTLTFVVAPVPHCGAGFNVIFVI